ncbi:transcriptional regulator, LacI family [Nocardioides terrae]|uniref:Transcriptional regulator, LacI family n=1 Tax=Nocardioides terrae TaxID=574651 RepID=A0A1I1L2J6_9ACTN|nr:LacI family DNA-binding transcriptional regulator [Nocardioides terrae]SFC67259.1 transcriptional regulator, LacI family [Nocardioides terrae]
MTPSPEQPARPAAAEPRRRSSARSTPTIYDVARAAGVASSTVSRAFSRPDRVNAETAARIRAVAADLGYRTNPLARALPTGQTSMIALATADITNPYYFELIRGAQAAAAERGYTTLLADAQESVAIEREGLERVIPTVEGIVLASTRMSDSAIRMLAKQRPVIAVNRDISDVPNVVTDHAMSMRQAVDHLADLGHRQITYLSGPEAAWANGMRWRSLRLYAGERGIHVRRIGPYAPTAGGGARAAADFPAVRSSAVIAYNDLVAIGFMRRLISFGARIPGDVSVVGFDNIFTSALTSPELTTVAPPLRTLGSMAVHNLLALIGGASPTTVRPLALPTRIYVRASTAAPATRRRSWRDAPAPREPATTRGNRLPSSG